MEPNTYLFDPENAAEMGRLLLQDRLINEAMGGLLPERNDLEQIFHVLDIGCGPGGWALKVATRYPHIKVTGIDVSELMIKFARVQAEREGLSNAHFEVMNALSRLGFPDGLFDLVNMRAAGAWIPREKWPSVVAECNRVVRPGGVIRLTEYGPAESNSQIVNQIMEHISLLLGEKGYGFSRKSATFGLIPMLAKFLKEDAGCKNVQCRLTGVNYSFGAPLHDSQFRNLLTAWTQMKPLFLEEKILTEGEWLRFDDQLHEEIKREDFRGLQYWGTCWGEKPGGE